MPLIGYDINERNLELWLSDQNDVTSEPFMDFSEDETPFIIASTLENLDYGYAKNYPFANFVTLTFG